MTSEALHPTPERAVVVREQLRATGLAVRTELLLFALVLAVLTVTFAIAYVRALDDPNSDMSFRMLPEAALPMMFLSFFVPLLVWKGEGPSRRTYLWSMPVERSWHQLVRAFSGWGWFMAVIAAYLLWVLALALIAGGEIGVVTDRVFIGENLRNATREDWRVVTWTVPAWMWAVPFVAATVGYLIGSIVALASDHPWRWFGGILFGTLLLSAISDAADWNGIERLMRFLFASTYGLETLFSGMRDVTEPVVRRNGEVSQWHHSVPDLGRWLTSVAIWTGVAGAGVFIAARRHQEA